MKLVHLIFLFVLLQFSAYSQNIEGSIHIESSDYDNSELIIGTTVYDAGDGIFRSAAHHIVSKRDYILYVDSLGAPLSGRAFTLRMLPDTDVLTRGRSLFVVNTLGNIGIGDFEGTTGPLENPKSRLHVKDGDVFIDDIQSGVIMKSPDGNCWRMRVSNTGEPVFTSVNCPDN